MLQFITWMKLNILNGVDDKQVKVILISGKARSGKDTCADYIKRQIDDSQPNSKVVIVRYADELKYIARRYFGWNGKKDKEGRNLLQTVGDMIRDYDKDYFVNRLIKQARVLNPDYLIIPDTRYKNEIDNWLFQGFSVFSVRIVRASNNGLTVAQKSHQSECELDNYCFNYRITNNWTKEDFKKEVEHMVEEWIL